MQHSGHPTTNRRRRHARGLTLLEIMIVVGILVLLMGIGIAGFDRLAGVRLRKETNRVAAAIRYTYNRSVAMGLYMRMVIDLDGEAYRVEASEAPQFLRRKPAEAGVDPDAEPEPTEAEARKSGRNNSGSSSDPDPLDPAAKRLARRAQYVQDDVIPDVKLEGGAGFDGVVVGGHPDAISSGKAYIHFFPNGWVEPAYIYTTDGEGSFLTLRIHPLTGKVTHTGGKVDPDRHFGEAEKVEVEGE